MNKNFLIGWATNSIIFFSAAIIIVIIIKLFIALMFYSLSWAGFCEIIIFTIIFTIILGFLAAKDGVNVG